MEHKQDLLDILYKQNQGRSLKLKHAGKMMMLAGGLLVLAAAALFVHNRKEASEAGSAADFAVSLIKGETLSRMTNRPYGYGVDENGTETTELFLIDGYRYIGILTLPSLGLELPVMEGWSYPQLKLSPCRYSGSAATDDLVIIAHNYDRHFGRIKNLAPGDEAYFTDLEGGTYCYGVELTETVDPQALEYVTDGKYDLTLVTCTYGGKARVVARCGLSE